MECLVAFLILMIVFVVMTGTVARAQARSVRRRRVYCQVAKRFAGKYVPGGLFGRPGIRFRYGDARAFYREARAIPPLSGRCAEMKIDWPNARLQLELFRNPNRIHPAGFRPQVVGISQREFTTDYIVNGRDDADTANLMSEGVRWQLNRLRLSSDNDNLYLRIHHGRLTCQIPGRLRREEDLAQFVQLVFELYDQAMLTQVVGIDFLDTDLAQPLEDVICKVCGDVIESEMVCCHRCKTPHHQDCWTYNGACSVYGCLETRYIEPRIVQPISPRGAVGASGERAPEAGMPDVGMPDVGMPDASEAGGPGAGAPSAGASDNPFRPR